MNYLEIANSRPMYLVTLFILVLLMAQAVIFFRMAMKRAKELKIEKQVIHKAVKAAAITTIVPSIAIIIGLISLSPILGIPVSWARLGMAGSMMYELTVAAIGAQAMGTELGGAMYSPQAFANSVWLMTLGVTPGFVLAVLFLRKYKSGIKKAVSKDTTFQTLILTTILVSVQMNFIAPAVIGGGNALNAVVIAAVVMAVLTVCMVKLKWSWLKEYALSISMITAVGAIVLMQI
ncbi:DUF5058 family protein [Fusibacter paucivorans]|uniref:DUF5058 family protein n=1 Tax=Fusibacter paucivorans TaxID=76009 RepID=A0ABS5PJA3_9FIRM|nr:DUF5058 family protein [Fusibacter paucivorans]